MDGAALGAMTLAVDKAYTAVLWEVPTGEFMASTQPGGADWGFNTTTAGAWSSTPAACRSSPVASCSAASA